MTTEVTHGMSKMRWIEDFKFDTLFFIFPIPLMFLYYYLFTFLAQPSLLGETAAAMAVVFVFNAFIDYPHLMSTLIRTHKDDEMRSRYPLFFKHDVLFLVVLCIFLIFLAHHISYQLITVLGIWHIMRQNWGFLRAYAIKNTPKGKISTFLEKFSFHATTFVFMLTPLAKDWAVTLWPFCLLTIILYLLSLIGSRELKLSSFSREFFYLSIVFSLYLVFFELDVPFILQATVCSVHHDISYLGFVYLYQKKVLKLDRNAIKKNFRFIYRVSFLAALLVLIPFFEMFYLVFLLMHFIVDGFIWKFGNYPELRALFVDEH